MCSMYLDVVEFLTSLSEAAIHERPIYEMGIITAPQRRLRYALAQQVVG